jgi:hypothetical protein
MVQARATAEVFWTAFLAMEAGERQAFIERLIGDSELREDLLDAALIEERKDEPTRPLQDVLAEAERKKAARSR